MNYPTLYDHPWAQLPDQEKKTNRPPAVKSNINYSRHGHATKKIPAVKGWHSVGRQSYRKGRKAALEDTCTLGRLEMLIERWYELAAAKHFPIHRNRKDYKEHKRWLHVVDHMAKQKTIHEAAVHAYALVWAAEDMELKGDHKTCFIGKRWLQFSGLPKHNRDCYTGQEQPFGHVGKRLWSPVGKSILGVWHLT